MREDCRHILADVSDSDATTSGSGRRSQLKGLIGVTAPAAPT